MANLRPMSGHVFPGLGPVGGHVFAELGPKGFEIAACGRLGGGGCACHIQSLAQTDYSTGREIAYSRASARASQLASMMSVELPTVVQ